jgi:hypothetical protein
MHEKGRCVEKILAKKKMKRGSKTGAVIATNVNG